MAASKPKNIAAQQHLEDEFKQLQLSVPKEKWFNYQLYYYKGFWCPSLIFEGIVSSQIHFQAFDTDIILASFPKTGTTWLKSLLFTIVNRKDLSHVSQHILPSKNPHELVLGLDLGLGLGPRVENRNLTDLPSPQLLSTHVPYLSLPDSIGASKCQIVYVCRNPLDTFVSSWHFNLQFVTNEGIKQDMELMEEHVGKYCKGLSPFGPYEDHLLGYWQESKQNPQKVLFLEYEGLKKEPKAHLKKLADFVGYPFSKEEEEGSVIEEIIHICSLKNLKEMEVNKNGNFYGGVKNKDFFRKGEVGDWTNYLTPSMAKQFERMQLKLKDAGFSSTYYPINV